MSAEVRCFDLCGSPWVAVKVAVVLSVHGGVAKCSRALSVNRRSRDRLSGRIHRIRSRVQSRMRMAAEVSAKPGNKLYQETVQDG